MHIINATNQGTLASLKRATAIANDKNVLLTATHNGNNPINQNVHKTKQ